MKLDYILKTLKNLNIINLDGKWYPFESKNHNSKDLLEVVKLRIDLSGDFIISNDYKYFRRINKINTEPYNNEINHFIEWRNQDDIVFDYSHLPEPVFKKYSKTEWDKLTGRK